MKRILVVEDDLKIASAIALRLEAEGYEVLTAPDGLGGLAYTLDYRPDLIIMDIMMPNGLGLSVAQRLQELGFAGIPIIFISACKLASIQQTALRIGAFAFIEKPYEASHLLQTVARALESRDPEAEVLCVAA